MKQIILSDEEYDVLISELESLYSYHWNDPRIHADNCGTKSQSAVESNTKQMAIKNLLTVCRMVADLELVLWSETGFTWWDADKKKEEPIPYRLGAILLDMCKSARKVLADTQLVLDESAG